MIEVKKKADLFVVAKNDMELQKALNEIKGINIEIKGKVSEKGHLFAGIHKEQIVEEIKREKGINFSPDMIILEHPIKEVGEHNIPIKIGNKEVTFKLVIKGE